MHLSLQVLLPVKFFFKKTEVEKNKRSIVQDTSYLLSETGVTLNTVMSNSFGFGGTNAALIFEKV